MKRGLFIALAGIMLLLWVEQGLAVSYGWKTLAKILLFLAIPLLVFRDEVRQFMAFRRTDRRRVRIALRTGSGVMAVIFVAYLLLSRFIDAEALTEDLAGRVGVTGAV